MVGTTDSEDGENVELGEAYRFSSRLASDSDEYEISEDKTLIQKDFTTKTPSHTESDHTKMKTSDNVDRSSNAYLLSCFFCFLMTVAQALSMVAAQLLDGIVPMFQLNMGGFGFALLSVIPYILYKTPSLRFPVRTIPLLILLSLTLYLQNITFFAATLYIPVGTNHSLNKFTSIMVTLIIAHIRWRIQGVVRLVDLLLDLSAAIVMIVGILMVIQPQFLFPDNEPIHGNITSYCNPDRLFNDERKCSVLINTNATQLSESTPNVNANTDKATDECLDPSRPAWIGYMIGIMSGLLAVSKIFLVPAILVHMTVAQVMFLVPCIIFVLSTVTAVAMEDFHYIQGLMCVILLICNFIGAAGAHVGFIAVMIHMPTTDYTIVSCLALVMLMIFQFTLLTSYVPTRTDTIAVIGAIIISGVALGKPILHRWISSSRDKKSQRCSIDCMLFNKKI